MAADRDSSAAPASRTRVLVQGVLAWATLALATLAICWPLGLTNRILAGVDALTYFTPYWAYRMVELRAGHLPLWNPYLFAGVPFLANPQAAALYPLHWPLVWMEPSQALIWSALLHVWLAAGLMYTFARRSAGLSSLASWLAGVVFGLGGFTLAKIENINQLNGLAWLPAMLWLFDETRRAARWRHRVRWGVALAIVIALQLLAGHTQTAFINLVGLGVYAVWPVGKSLYEYVARLVERRRSGLSDVAASPPLSPSPTLPLSRSLAGLLPLFAIIPAFALAAAQLLPSLELSALGLRAGGLSYRLAASFSLRPRLLAQTFLPPVGSGLAEAFGSEGYAEFVGYIGVTGLILATIGVLSMARRRSAKHSPEALGGLALLAAVGMFLALGAYNPIYYLLWRFVPGFDLFRAPARWLALYAVGAAGLAGVGFDAWLPYIRSPEFSGRLRVPSMSKRARILAIVAALIALALLIAQQLPPWRALLCWAAAVLLTIALLLAGRRWPRLAQGGLIALALVELWIGSRALPFTLATAPAALSLRNAPAALLAATADQPPAGRDRFLSMSDIRYDPGDLAELRALQADKLPAEAVERFVRAAKWAEVIAPNLSMLWRLPAVDGYDGGVLPTAVYGMLQSLFLLPEDRLPDGRLREQLRTTPPDRLLDLTGVRFIITDKQRDLWAGDVYYDLEQMALLQPGESLTLDLASYPPFAATALGVVASGNDGEAQADITVTGASGEVSTLPLSLRSEAPGAETQPVIVPLPAPTNPTTLTVRVLADSPAALALRGLSLIDDRTGAHQSITLSARGDLRRIHSGDVKVYERRAAPGRAWIVHGLLPVQDDAEALRELADPGFDPRQSVIAPIEAPARPPAGAAPGESLNIASHEPERVVLHADVKSPAFLVLADAAFPGWEAMVDGVPAPVLRANLMFRAIGLEPGSHEIVFAYRPTSWRWGLIISVGALGVLVLLLLTTFSPRFERVSRNAI
jgi:hypothetical protein